MADDEQQRDWKPWPCGPDHNPAEVRAAQEAVLVALDAVMRAYGCDDQRALAYLELHGEFGGDWHPAAPREPAPAGCQWHRVSSGRAPHVLAPGATVELQFFSTVRFRPKTLRLPRSIAPHVTISVDVGNQMCGGTSGGHGVTDPTDPWSMPGEPFGTIHGGAIDMPLASPLLYIRVKVCNRSTRPLEGVEVSVDGWRAAEHGVLPRAMRDAGDESGPDVPPTAGVGVGSGRRLEPAWPPPSWSK